MRVFIGIPLSIQLQETIEKWQKAYEDRYFLEGVRFIKKNDLHITLIPPWQEKNIEEVIKTFQENKISLASFEVLFTNILFVPNNNPKYIWATGETPQQLLVVRQSILAVLSKPLEKREFRLHCIIARLQKNARFAQPVQTSEKILMSMQVKSFALFASHLSPKGADYEILATIPLT